MSWGISRLSTGAERADALVFQPGRLVPACAGSDAKEYVLIGVRLIDRDCFASLAMTCGRGIEALGTRRWQDANATGRKRMRLAGR